MFDVCLCDQDYELASVFNVRQRRAAKRHVCEECRETIEPGERYEYTTMCLDGSWSRHKVCLPCVAVREDLFCGVHVAGGVMWEQIHEAICLGHHCDDDFCLCPRGER